MRNAPFSGPAAPGPTAPGRYRERVVLGCVAVVLLGVLALTLAHPSPSPALTGPSGPHRAGPPGQPGVGPAGHYVALGDSYAAGIGIPELTGQPAGCGRSSNDYPSLVAAAGHYALFADVSCSGATTADMTQPQPTRTGPSPPQLQALTGDTTLVTLTIGENDIGFADIIASWLSSSGVHLLGAPCRAHYHPAGRDVLADRIAATAPKIAAVLTEITKRAPAARVLVVGYPTIWSDTGQDCPQAPLSTADAVYLTNTFQALNTMLNQQADTAGAHYVDTATSSTGHSICASPATRWVEGLHPSSPAAPWHPNAGSMRNSANHIIDHR